MEDMKALLLEYDILTTKEDYDEVIRRTESNLYT